MVNFAIGKSAVPCNIVVSLVLVFTQEAPGKELYASREAWVSQGKYSVS